MHSWGVPFATILSHEKKFKKSFHFGVKTHFEMLFFRGRFGFFLRN